MGRTSLSNYLNRLLRKLQLLILLMAAASTTRCSLVDDIKDQINGDKINHCEPGRPTEVYFSDAIHYRSSDQKWIFHNWKGTASDGGCDIHINIHDGQITLSPLVRQSIQSTATAWKNAIAAMGVSCNLHFHFESLSDTGVSITPRIDMEFVKLLSGGDIAGSTVVMTSDATRQFNSVQIQLASDLILNNDTLAIPETEYPAVLAHEFGHAFGIFGFEGATGHSTEAEDVMYPSAECSALSKGDIETMRDIYTRPPYYTPVVSGAVHDGPDQVTRVVCKLR